MENDSKVKCDCEAASWMISVDFGATLALRTHPEWKKEESKARTKLRIIKAKLEDRQSAIDPRNVASGALYLDPPHWAQELPELLFY